MASVHRSAREVWASWAVAAAFVALIASAGAPSPLFAVLQEKYGLSDADLTASFAVYVVGVGCALSVSGRLADLWGRKIISITAVVAGAGASVLMSVVDSAWLLHAGRLLQGLTVGLGSAALGAWFYELRLDRPALATAIVSGTPTGGLAVGALVAGAGLDMLHGTEGRVMWPIAGLLLVLAALASWAPETSTRESRARASAGPARVWQRPRGGGAAFVSAAVLGAAMWVLGGVYQSVGATVMLRELGVNAHVLGASAVAALVGVSAVTGLVCRGLSTSAVRRLGASLLVLGGSADVVALWIGSPAGFLVATVVLGIGHGAILLMAVRVVTALTEPDRRSSVLAAFYLICYAGSVLPLLAAGLLADLAGLRAAMALAAVTTALAAAGFAMWNSSTHIPNQPIGR